jgi:ammonia channel protein AmtB
VQMEHFFNHNTQIDDTLSVFSCHGFGGTIGMILTGDMLYMALDEDCILCPSPACPLAQLEMDSHRELGEHHTDCPTSWALKVSVSSYHWYLIVLLNRPLRDQGHQRTRR